MGLARTRGAVVLGVQGHVVEVEAHLTSGLPAMTIVGLPDAAVAESRDRARAAVVNSGGSWPQGRITVGLSPASLHKRGSGLDLAVAAVVLAASDQLAPDLLRAAVLLGELGLDGRVRPVRGVVVGVLAAQRAGAPVVVVPVDNAAEARLVPGVRVVAVHSLAHLVAVLRGTQPGADVPAAGTRPTRPAPDLRDVRGQLEARAALEVAAAGGHHLAMIGPPGVGKTLLAERLPGLLPDLDAAAALEVTAVRSVAGRLEPGEGLVTRPPFEAPHHTASYAAVVGGGSGSTPRAGLVALAHRGVLFLDEAPEFQRSVLEALRQPLESGEVVVARAGLTVRYPARFQLVLAANPCPCGRSVGTGADCSCTPLAIRRYRSRLSGPLLDRVDLRVQLHTLRPSDLGDRAEPEATAAVAARVAMARDRSGRRLAGTPWRCNAEVPAGELRRRWPPTQAARRLLDDQLRRGRLTLRGGDRVLRVSWTLADLAGGPVPGDDQVAAALVLRTADVAWAA